MIGTIIILAIGFAFGFACKDEKCRALVNKAVDKVKSIFKRGGA